MDDNIYKTYLESDDPSLWEQLYVEFVSRGRVSIDEWILDWMWERISLPESEDYSIFSPNKVIDANLMGVKVELSTLHQKKVRYVRLALSQHGSLHPDFEYFHQPNETNKRFESVGNPFIDTPNYRWWEEYLFFSLTSEILFQHGGLDAFVELLRKHH
jgi:hypothetical protein